MIDTLLSILCVSLGILCFIGSFERLRMLNWKSSKAPYVGLYLSWMIWAAANVWYALFEFPPYWYSVFGLSGALCWLIASHDRWTRGPPADATRPAALDETDPRERRRGQA